MSDKKKVLVLDDQQSIKNIITFALKKDFDITVTGTSDEAIAKAKEGGFDFVLLDIVLDDDSRDGIGVAQELQAQGLNFPVAFLSSMDRSTLDDDMSGRVETLNNIKFYQTKPIAPPDLISKIKAVVGE